MRYTIDPNSPYHQLELNMMRVAVRAEKKFLKNCGPEYAEHIKKIKKTPITIITSEKLISCYGIASKEDLTSKLFSLSITLTHKIGDYSKALIYEIVSHELAHCIDFIVRGESNHDAPWREIHQLMGGTGHTEIEYRVLPRKTS
jgi:hypothetical protein